MHQFTELSKCIQIFSLYLNWIIAFYTSIINDKVNFCSVSSNKQNETKQMQYFPPLSSKPQLHRVQANVCVNSYDVED